MCCMLVGQVQLPEFPSLLAAAEAPFFLHHRIQPVHCFSGMLSLDYLQSAMDSVECIHHRQRPLCTFMAATLRHNTAAVADLPMSAGSCSGCCLNYT